MFSDRSKTIALVAAAAVFLLMVGVLRIWNWMPFVAAGATWLGVILAMAEPPPKKGPGGATDRKGRRAEDRAIAQLRHAAKRLDNLARKAPAPDRPLFQRMADLMQTLCDHHIANPAHVTLTQKFRKHVAGRMITSVSDYIELTNRSGDAHKDRLADISRQLETFVPVLEKIDRACIDNDLTELEINVEVLNDQLDRSR